MKKWNLIVLGSIFVLVGCGPKTYVSVSGRGTSAEFEQAKAICNQEVAQMSEQKMDQANQRLERERGYTTTGKAECTKSFDGYDCEVKATTTRDSVNPYGRMGAAIGIQMSHQSMYDSCMARSGFVEGAAQRSTSSIPNDQRSDYRGTHWELVGENSLSDNPEGTQCVYKQKDGDALKIHEIKSGFCTSTLSNYFGQ